MLRSQTIYKVAQFAHFRLTSISLKISLISIFDFEEN